jgi:putative protein kinase ArgK-like GTPase of G3E family
METMKPVMMALQTLAAIESEARELIQSDASSKPSAETDAEIAPLIENIGASSIAGIERLVAELQEARNFLQSEGKRIQRETARYINLARTASASVEIMFDAVRPVEEVAKPRISRISGVGDFRYAPTP